MRDRAARRAPQIACNSVQESRRVSTLQHRRVRCGGCCGCARRRGRPVRPPRWSPPRTDGRYQYLGQTPSLEIPSRRGHGMQSLMCCCASAPQTAMAKPITVDNSLLRVRSALKSRAVARQRFSNLAASFFNASLIIAGHVGEGDVTWWRSGAP